MVDRAHDELSMQPSREKFLLHQETMLFVAASRRYPASVVAQGAVIAQKCLATYQNPLELQAALPGNKDRLRGIVRAATGAHAKSHNEKRKIPLFL